MFWVNPSSIYLLHKPSHPFIWTPLFCSYHLCNFRFMFGFFFFNSKLVWHAFFFVRQPGMDGRNCYADEHYLPTFFHVRKFSIFIVFSFLVLLPRNCLGFFFFTDSNLVLSKFKFDKSQMLTLFFRIEILFISYYLLDKWISLDVN